MKRLLFKFGQLDQGYWVFMSSSGLSYFNISIYLIIICINICFLTVSLSAHIQSLSSNIHKQAYKHAEPGHSWHTVLISCLIYCHPAVPVSPTYPAASRFSTIQVVTPCRACFPWRKWLVVRGNGLQSFSSREKRSSLACNGCFLWNRWRGARSASNQITAFLRIKN